MEQCDQPDLAEVQNEDRAFRVSEAPGLASHLSQLILSQALGPFKSAAEDEKLACLATTQR